MKAFLLILILGASLIAKADDLEINIVGKLGPHQWITAKNEILTLKIGDLSRSTPNDKNEFRTMTLTLTSQSGELVYQSEDQIVGGISCNGDQCTTWDNTALYTQRLTEILDRGSPTCKIDLDLDDLLLNLEGPKFDYLNEMTKCSP